MTHLLLTRGANSVLLDLFENDPVQLNKLYSNIETFEIQGSFSQTFRVPMTPTNQAFFGALGDPNYITFDMTTRIDAELSEDTIPIARGHCQIKRIITKSDNATELELVFFASTPNLKVAVGDKKIGELTNLPTLNHEMVYDVVTSPPANTLWSLIERGQKFSEGAEAGTRRVFDTNTPLYVGDLTPSVNALWLWQQIFQDAGFTYESDFIDETLVDYWLVFNNSQAVKVEETENIGFAIARATNFSFSGLSPRYLDGTNSYNETFDNGNNVTGGVFTAPFTGYYTFRFVLFYSKDTVPANNVASSRFQLRDPIADGIYPDVNGQIDMFVQTGQSGVMQQFQYTRTYFFLDGQQARLTFALANSPGGTDYTLGGGTGWELVSTSDALQGGTVDFARNAPDYKQEAFIRDILRMHNLVFIPDPNVPNKLEVAPFVDYIGSGATRDWTGKIDISSDKDVTIYSTADIQSKNLTFTYKAGGEYLSDLFVKQGGRVYGEKKIDNTGNDFATGDKKIELELRSTPSNEINGTAIPVPKFVNESGVYVAPQARLLFNGGVAEIAMYDEVADAGVLTNVSILSHYSNYNPTLTDRDLNWNVETPLQVITASPFNNLYNEFWASYYNELYSDESRIMEATFNLSLVDFITVQFKDRIFIRNAYWRILEINDFFVGAQSMCKVKLAKIVSLKRDCKFIPSTIWINGKVTFVDGSGTPSNGNELCCTRYGYAWDTNKGECFASPFGGNRRFQLPTSQEISESMVAVRSSNNEINDEAMVNGNNNIVGTNTRVSQVNGDNNEIENDAGSSMVIGTGALVKHSGYHMANSDTQGRHQSGEILLTGTGDYTVSADGIEVIPANGKRLNLEDGMVWLCEARVSAVGALKEPHVAVFQVLILKNVIAGAGAVTTLFQDGVMNVLSLNVDIITNTAEHRFKVVSTGGSGYPFNDVQITMNLKYTQVL